MASDVRSGPRLSRGLFYLAIIAMVMIGIAGFILSQRSEGGAVNIAEGPPKPLPVSVSTVRFSDTLNIREQYTGLVSARRTSELGFETGGRIERVLVDVGDQVASGQKLALLDTRTIQANLNAANAQIGEAQASLKLARSTVERQAQLEAKGLLSAQSYDEASAQEEAALARLDAASAQAEALKVRLELASLRAPFDGVVTQRFRDEGAIASPGTPVVQLVESSVLETAIGLPGHLADRLDVGKTYPVDIAGTEVEATLRSMTGVIDTNMRTVTAVFDLPESIAASAGDVARLQLEQSLSQSGFWVPVSALSEAERGLWSIYVVRDDDAGTPRAEKSLVDLLHAEADRAFVRGALDDGDLFITDGLHRLAPRQIISPVMTNSAAFAER